MGGGEGGGEGGERLGRGDGEVLSWNRNFPSVLSGRVHFLVFYPNRASLNPEIWIDTSELSGYLMVNHLCWQNEISSLLVI